MQQPIPSEEFLDTLRKDFPVTDEDTAGQLAELIGEEAHAQQNILDMLRESSPPVTNDTLNLITHQIESALSAHDPYGPGFDEAAPGPLPYFEEDGFPKFRTKVITLACSLLPDNGLEKTIQVLEDLNSWITLQDQMGLHHEANTLEEYQSIQNRWQRNVIEGKDPADAAALLQCPQQQLASWTPAIASRKFERYTATAITKELQLAQAAAAVDPEFWKRYAGECRRNRALPFQITNNHTGELIDLALMRFRKGRWYIAIPNSYRRTAPDFEYSDKLHKEFQRFGRDYNQAASSARPKKMKPSATSARSETGRASGS